VIEWIMMGAFIVALGLSVWKLYYFFPTKPLADDDTTPESIAQLEHIMISVALSHPNIDEESLFHKMTEHPEFDPKHYWRFNQNRLRHLIEHYRTKEPNFHL